jgi:hypothetical protein
MFVKPKVSIILKLSLLLFIVLLIFIGVRTAQQRKEVDSKASEVTTTPTPRVYNAPTSCVPDPRFGLSTGNAAQANALNLSTKAPLYSYTLSVPSGGNFSTISLQGTNNALRMISNVNDFTDAEKQNIRSLANREHWWTLSNEPNATNTITPQNLARSYHALVQLLKGHDGIAGLDPTAHIAFAGLGLFPAPAPSYDQYTRDVLNSYAAQFRSEMPVEAFLMHVYPDVASTLNCEDTNSQPGPIYQAMLESTKNKAMAWINMLKSPQTRNGYFANTPVWLQEWGNIYWNWSGNYMARAYRDPAPTPPTHTSVHENVYSAKINTPCTTRFMNDMSTWFKSVANTSAPNLSQFYSFAVVNTLGTNGSWCDGGAAYKIPHVVTNAPKEHCFSQWLMDPDTTQASGFALTDPGRAFSFAANNACMTVPATGRWVHYDGSPVTSTTTNCNMPLYNVQNVFPPQNALQVCGETTKVGYGMCGACSNTGSGVCYEMSGTMTQASNAALCMGNNCPGTLSNRCSTYNAQSIRKFAKAEQLFWLAPTTVPYHEVNGKVVNAGTNPAPSPMSCPRNLPGVGNIKVQISSSTLSLTTTTDSQGNFYFYSIPNGTYNVCPIELSQSFSNYCNEPRDDGRTKYGHCATINVMNAPKVDIDLVLKETNIAPIGSVESANCTGVTGWTCDANSYQTPLRVDVYADGPYGTGWFAGKATANIQKSAIASLCGATTNHGFNFVIPDRLRDNQTHKLYFYALGIDSQGRLNVNNPLLNTQGVAIRCQR